MLKKIMVVMLVLVTVQGCTSFGRPDLKSPCTGAEGSPCGPRHHVNDWWLS